MDPQMVIQECAQLISCVRLFVTPGTAARQAPLSKGFSRQEYWSGLPFPSPEDLPNPGMEHTSPTFPASGRQILYHWATEEVPIQEDHPAKTQDNFTCPTATEQNKIIDSCKCDFHGTLPAHIRCRVGWTWCADFMCYLLFLEKNIDYLILTRNYLNFDNCNHLWTDCNKATERRDRLLEFENTAYWHTPSVTANGLFSLGLQYALHCYL